MNSISTIIETLLDEHRDAHTFLSNPDLSSIIANALTVASWQQLAAVTGAALEHDNDGQLVLYTGCHVEVPEPKIIYAREPTQADIDAAAAFKNYKDASGKFTLKAREVTKPLDSTQEEDLKARNN